MPAYLKKLFSHNPLVARKPLIRVFVEPPRRGFVQVPEDHLADLAARSPLLAARDAVFTAFLHRRHAEVIQINVGSPMFTLWGCWAGHGTGSYQCRTISSNSVSCNFCPVLTERSLST